MNITSAPNSIRFRLLGVNSIRLAVPEEQVTTVVEWSEPTPLPFGPKAVVGVVCVQGRMFTVLNLMKLLRPGEDAGLASRAIVALRGDEQLALAVDEGESTIDINRDNINPLEDEAGSLFRESFNHDGNTWRVLSVNELFNSLVQGRERRRRRS